jgi:TRAP-type uncharacterized transport system substrate-binding protein
MRLPLIVFAFFVPAMAASAAFGQAAATPPQAAAAQAMPADQDCNSLCRVVRTFTGPAAQPAPSPAENARPAAAARVEASARRVARVDHKIRFVTESDGSDDRIVSDLAAVLEPEFPVDSVAGQGSILKELLTLPKIDLAITTNLSLERGSDYADRLVYVAKLFTQELHVVVGDAVAGLDDLSGRPVFMGDPGSDSAIAAQALLAEHDVTVKPVAGSLQEALGGLREGRVAAVMVLAPKPFEPLAALTSSDGVKLLPVSHGAATSAFYPAVITAAAYPGLVPDDRPVESVALDAILVAPWWRDSSPRQDELTAMTRRLLEHFSALQEPGRHPKWEETNLAAALPGLRRLKPADQWVAAKLKEADRSGKDARKRVGDLQ